LYPARRKRLRGASSGRFTLPKTLSRGLYYDFQTVSQNVFSEVQLRDAERRSVTKVMSSSRSQPSPTKE
jgi:hypothetical protein